MSGWKIKEKMVSSLSLSWYLPVSGEGRTLLAGESDAGGVARRPPTLGYLRQIAMAADQLGFDSILVPTDTGCEDPWVVSSALAGSTERVRFLIAIRPGLIAPTLLAQMAAAFQRISRNRLLLNVVTGAQGPEMLRFGDHLGKDERYARTVEYLDVMRGAWDGSPFSYRGTYYDVQDAIVVDPPRWPQVYFGGASPAALPVAARHADTYIMFGEPPAQTEARIAALRAVVDAEGRAMPRLSVRFHVVTRPTSAEAWEAAYHILDGATDELIAATQQAMSREQAVGEQQMHALVQDLVQDREKLEVYPNLWAGIGLLRRGAGTALVGSYQEVADRIAEYHSLGVDSFVLSGYPNLEEAYQVGEGVMPALAARGLM